MSCRLSIILAAQNEEAYIAEALGSVLAQAHTGTEIVFVDDGSKDDTWGIVDGLAGDLPEGVKLRRVRHDANRGLARARNRAIAMAQGEHVMFMDADDAFEPGTLASLLAQLDRGDDVRLVFPRYRWVGGDGSSLSKMSPVPSGAITAEQLLFDNPIHSDSGVTMRRQDFLSIGGFDEEMTGYIGGDAWLRFALHYGSGAIASTPEAIVRYRRHDRQTTANWQRMDQNWGILAGKLERDHPEFYATFGPRAKARHRLFCAHLAYGGGEDRIARRFLWQALRGDPAMLVSRKDARLLAASCLAAFLPASLLAYLRSHPGPR
ncbi:glycosyltransferase family 2 protein [Erythrobacter sp.]|jgi:glycosyltransferase involved in cell wall biosynthesis|uniref:glycosyltransferase family 2 protein n=1 Tax=Erythrobacter sp. TaxID=1042 RepID=UPI002EB986A4|nr:glycosyltransferase family 2 protein [Erythrobacter sp.]